MRAPVAEAPIAAPVKPCSEIGVSTIRFGAELLPEALGVGEGAAALAGAFAEIDDVRIAPHLLGDAVAHRVEPARGRRSGRRPAGASASGGLIGSA